MRLRTFHLLFTIGLFLLNTSFLNASTIYTLQKAKEYRSSNPDSALIIIDSVYRKANETGFKNSSKYQIYYTYGMICARVNQARQSIKFLQAARATDTVAENPAINAPICAALSEQYMFLGEYDQALSFALEAYKYAEKADDKEYMSTCLAVIGNVYSQMKMFDKAHIYIDRAILLAQNFESKILYKYVKGDVFSQEGEFEKSAVLMQQLLDELNSTPTEEIQHTYYRNPVELSYFKAEILSQMAYSLIMSKSPTKAKIACAQAIKLIRPIDQIRMPVYLSLFNYMKEAKNWHQLIFEVKRILPKIEMGDSINNYNYTLKIFLSDAYAGLGNWHQAYLYRLEANNLLESLTEKMKVAAALELGTLYETSEKDAQILTQKYVIKAQKNRTFVLIFILILLSTFMIIIYNNLRGLKRKNKKIFEQMALVSKKEDQLDNLKAIAPTLPEIHPENKLFMDVERLMKTSELFLSSNINRKEVANELSTNENYLCSAIKDGCGLSFQNYIYELRLEYARKKLLTFNESATIESIALDCGFNSSRNFHRLFKEKFGMTPTEFKRLAQSK